MERIKEDPSDNFYEQMKKVKPKEKQTKEIPEGEAEVEALLQNDRNWNKKKVQNSDF